MIPDTKISSDNKTKGLKIGCSKETSNLEKIE